MTDRNRRLATTDEAKTWAKRAEAARAEFVEDAGEARNLYAHALWSVECRGAFDPLTVLYATFAGEFYASALIHRRRLAANVRRFVRWHFGEEAAEVAFSG